MDLLLETEPGELAGRGDSALAIHVRGCPRCQGVAAQLLAGQQELALALDEMRPRVGADAALSDALARRRRATWRRAAWRWVAPLATAAVLAGLLLLRSLQTGVMNGGSGTPYVFRSAPALQVEAPSGSDVMIFQVGDPAITVIWFGTRRTAQGLQ